MPRLVREHKFFIILMMIVTLLLFYKPTQVYPFWFDEGWTLSLARNWVEYGHYGERNAGEFVPSTMLVTGFPATSLYAVVFWIFGVGGLQARILGNCLVIVTLILLYGLVLVVFDRKTAILAAIIALFGGVHPFLLPLLTGRQALGEIPMLMYVLAGFLSLHYLRKKHYALAGVAAFFFALAIHTKPQILPFLATGLTSANIISVLKRDRKDIMRYTTLTAGTAIIAVVLSFLWSSYLNSLNDVSALSTDPYAVVRDVEILFSKIIIPRMDLRLLIVKQFGIGIALLGLVGIIGVALIKSGTLKRTNTPIKQALQSCDILGIMLWVIVTTWYGWWILLSNAWPRYVAPASFLASIFAAVLMLHIVDEMRRLPRHWNASSGRMKWIAMSLKVIGVLLIYAITFYRTIAPMAYWYSHPSSAVTETVEYLNTHAEVDAIVETYESELFFLLDVNYHYPPDVVQHVGVLRGYLGEDVSYEYDVSDAHPDYIVTGTANRWWQVYDEVISNGFYELVFSSDPYTVYQLVK